MKKVEPQICCRTHIKPLDVTLAELILALGQFKKVNDTKWNRLVPEENVEVFAHLHTGSSEPYMELGLSPSIVTTDGHHHKRQAAGIMFEIATRYAEKANAQVVQTGINVPECKIAGAGNRFLAQYPESPMEFGRVCVGFQEVFLNSMDGALPQTPDVEGWAE